MQRHTEKNAQISNSSNTSPTNSGKNTPASSHSSHTTPHDSHNNSPKTYKHLTAAEQLAFIADLFGSTKKTNIATEIFNINNALFTQTHILELLNTMSLVDVDNNVRINLFIKELDALIAKAKEDEKTDALSSGVKTLNNQKEKRKSAKLTKLLSDDGVSKLKEKIGEVRLHGREVEFFKKDFIKSIYNNYPILATAELPSVDTLQHAMEKGYIFVGNINTANKDLKLFYFDKKQNKITQLNINLPDSNDTFIPTLFSSTKKKK